MYKLLMPMYDNTDEQLDTVKWLCKEILGYTEEEVEIFTQKRFGCIIVKNLTLEQAQTITEIFIDNDIHIYLEDQRTDEGLYWKPDLGIELVHHPPKSHYCDEPLVSRDHLVDPSTQHELEYQERIRKAQSQKAMQEIERTKRPSTAECPYCHSTNTKKISGTSRMASVGFWGLLSGKIGKQWHCNNCRSDF